MHALTLFHYGYWVLKDSAWFYSTLAQVAASIAGVLGGFLILRLHDQIGDWRTLRTLLNAQQGAWSRAKNQEERFRDAYVKANGPGSIEGPTPELERADETWSMLVASLERRQDANFPRFLLSAGGMLVLLVIVGSVAPLFALDDPSVGRKSMFLALFLVPIIGFAVLTAVEAIRALNALNRFALWDHVQREYDQYLQNLDVWIKQIADRSMAASAPDSPVEGLMLEDRARSQGDLDPS